MHHVLEVSILHEPHGTGDRLKLPPPDRRCGHELALQHTSQTPLTLGPVCCNCIVQLYTMLQGRRLLPMLGTDCGTHMDLPSSCHDAVRWAAHTPVACPLSWQQVACFRPTDPRALMAPSAGSLRKEQKT